MENFLDTLRDLEILVLEAFRWPTALVVDPKIMAEVFGKYNFVKYKLPSTGETVPIKEGKTNEFRLEFSDLSEET